METREALTRFLLKCEERGLSPETRRKYQSYLRHFVDEHPDLPTDTDTINQFLKKRKETPGHRGDVFKQLQAFYSYLEQFEGIKSPVPPRGSIGRPRKAKPVTNLASAQLGETSALEKQKNSVGGVLESTNTSISTLDAIEAFIKSRKSQGVSEITVKDYYSLFKPFVFKYQALPLTVEPIEEFLASLQVGLERRWTYRRALVALYHFLEQRKKIPKDLVIIPPVKRPRKVRRVLTEEELRGLFAFTQDFQEKAILTFLIDGKVRASELVSLDREKVFPDHVTVDGKTDEREVPINPETYATLVQLAASGPLFRTNGRRMRRDYLRIVINRLMKRAGLKGKKLGPHILRHSASVQHMMFGGDLMSLKEELGHTQVSTTQIYAELASTQVKEIHQKVNVLGKITGQSEFERASCYGCGQEVVVEFVKLKETKCPGCGQVGNWHTPNHRAGGQPHG
ncbi:Tyrosine recombinase XerC [subsurface metagenome]